MLIFPANPPYLSLCLVTSVSWNRRVVEDTSLASLGYVR